MLGMLFAKFVLLQIAIFVVAALQAQGMVIDEKEDIQADEGLVDHTEPGFTVSPESPTPYIDNNCLAQCCDDEKARIVLPSNRTDSSKIVIPFNVELLHKCSADEIIKISEIESNVEMLEKLLAFAKRYKF